ncbi:MAG: DUF4384 domain-containing protein, partial [Cyanothece sp. SIO2G6]|nr:DUF4384 domain-containing protein [Cyanothece sp. SIO2G6]
SLYFGYLAATSLLGNLRVRSRLSIPTATLPDSVFAQYQQLTEPQHNPSNQIFASSQAWPGLLITSADGHGVATEVPWGGFTAGLLTYMLTQRLWWATSSLAINKELGQVVGGVEQLIGSQYRPAFVASSTTSSQLSTQKFNLLSLTDIEPNADGVVCNVDAAQKNVEMWMGGLPALVLQHCLPTSYVSFGPPSPSLPGGILPWAQVRSCTGLMAKAKLPVSANVPQSNGNATVESVTPGMLVHEMVRIIPQDIGLVVALGNELERIERVDATSALSSLASIKSTIAGEQQVDCVFDKVRTSDVSPLLFPLTEGRSDLQGLSSLNQGVTLSQMYGLFHAGRNLIPGTISTIEEAVKTSIRRVTPQFYSLLSEKLMRLTVNQGSSRLGGQVTLETVAPFARQIGQQYTARSPWMVSEFLPITPQQEAADHPTLMVGDQIQCRLQNYSDRTLYGILFDVDSRGTVTVLQPLKAENLDEVSVANAAIAPKTITTVPDPIVSFPWTVSNSPGVATVYVIMSTAPFTSTIAELSKLSPSDDGMRRPQSLSSPLPIVQAMLNDLRDASQPHLADFDLDAPTDCYCLSVDCWATFCFTYTVSTNVSPETSPPI